MLAVADAQDVESDLLPKIATGFCSGLARMGGLCGAISGGMMGIGLANGRSQPNASVDETYAQTQALITQFEEEFGAATCRELTGCDLRTEEGKAQFQQNNQHEKCLRYVERATALVLR